MVVLVGKEKIIGRMVANNHIARRYSGLAERLKVAYGMTTFWWWYFKSYFYFTKREGKGICPACKADAEAHELEAAAGCCAGYDLSPHGLRSLRAASGKGCRSGDLQQLSGVFALYPGAEVFGLWKTPGGNGRDEGDAAKVLSGLPEVFSWFWSGPVGIWIFPVSKGTDSSI